MKRLPAWAGDERACRAAWSRLAEPDDSVAAWFRDLNGPQGAVQVLLECESAEEVAAQLLQKIDPTASARSRQAILAAAQRWHSRLPGVEPRRDLDVLADCNGRIIIPGDSEWPPMLADLGEQAPVCLWVRGDELLHDLLPRSVAIVGTRSPTPYGQRIASDLASGVVEAGFSVVSGAAFGVDAHAHRAALAHNGKTLAFLACGVDRAYPLAHERLLDQICQSGAVISESAVGAPPLRWRFLLRNRLIAAASGAVVVVEAAWRSGALSTAAHAAKLGRPLGAVPGPVTSAASAGCHRALREMTATAVTCAADALELALPVGQAVGQYPESPESVQGTGRVAGVGKAADSLTPAQRRREILDALQERERRVLEVLPARGGVGLDEVANQAGFNLRETLAALGRLAGQGLAVCDADSKSTRWRALVPVNSRHAEQVLALRGAR